MPDDILGDDLTAALEARLAGWAPRSAGLDRDRLMFEAGRAAARAEGAARLRWVGGAIAGVMVVMGLGLGTLYVRERGRADGLAMALAEERAREVGVPGPEPVEEEFVAVEPDPSSYLAIMRGAGWEGRGMGEHVDHGEAVETWTPRKGVGLMDL